MVSILHRISGVLMFLLLPFIIWMFDTSVTSEVSYERLHQRLHAGIGVVPGWFWSSSSRWPDLGLPAPLVAGVRHLWMDATHSVSKEQGTFSAVVTWCHQRAADLLLGAKLFGLY
jgi:succinate dehydrogenase / fumarate reductase cytochrome b subunit